MAATSALVASPCGSNIQTPAIVTAFRNEITPGNFIFRTIEFEQMEYQTFCKEGDDERLYHYFKQYGVDFYKFMGLDESRLRFHDHEK